MPHPKGESRRRVNSNYEPNIRPFFEQPAGRLHFGLQRADFFAISRFAHSPICIRYRIWDARRAACGDPRRQAPRRNVRFTRTMHHQPFPVRPGPQVVMSSNPFDIAVFYESQGEAVARAFVLAAPREVVDRDELETWRIEGHLVGPTCRYSSTLQARIPLASRGRTHWGDRPALLAEAAIPDPCYWSTELPFLYRAVGEIAVDSATRLPFEQSFGMRPLSIVRRKLALNGKIWVPRGVRRTAVVDDAPLERWREADAVMVVDDPDESLCREADRCGAMLLAELPEAADARRAAMLRYGTHPSIVVVASSQTAFDPALLPLAKNTPAAHRLDPGATRLARGPIGIFDGEASDLAALPEAQVPLIVRRLLCERRSLVEARAACDRLQADLAGKCEAAGFIV